MSLIYKKKAFMNLKVYLRKQRSGTDNTGYPKLRIISDANQKLIIYANQIPY